MGRGDKIILDHYKKLAQVHGHSGRMSMQDQMIRERETRFIIEQLTWCLGQLDCAIKNAHVLEAGCGNGHLLAMIREQFPLLNLTAFEFTPELVELAQARALLHCQVYQGDCREAATYQARQFDVVITERVVINLLEWHEQKTTLQHIAAHLKIGGYYIMVESFQEGWEELNRARSEANLEPIPQSSHNRYLKELCISYMQEMGLTEVATLWPKQSLSTHFYVTRILQHFIPAGARSRAGDFLSEALPLGIGQYSPIQFRLFKKTAQQAFAPQRSQTTQT